MSSLTADERLALLNAMSKAVKPRLDEAKAEAQDGLMDRFAEDGTDRRAIMVGGEKVGEVGMSFTKAAPAVKPGHERARRSVCVLEVEGKIGPVRTQFIQATP